MILSSTPAEGPRQLSEIPDLPDDDGVAETFTHVSGAESHMEGFTTSLCAMLLSEACNVGMSVPR
ncbi:hypothetical protein [Microtetraspora malaysiensis]|uniref:hypothetical protein n=1 Tax=Microtetraspora malaysiensis TaxID=161358 RepID=UPI00082DC3E7|nr:hypothetical protein [Microtetraspora malaysiensis]